MPAVIFVVCCLLFFVCKQFVAFRKQLILHLKRKGKKSVKMSDNKAAKTGTAAAPTVSTQKSADLEICTLEKYLRSHSPEMLDKFYEHPTICMAVYRELPEIAQHYVVRILFVEQPVPQAVILSWGSQLYPDEHAEAIKVLTEMNVWCTKNIPGGLLAWELSSIFKKNLRIALLGGGKPWTMSHMLEKDSKPRDVAFLDNYAMSRWRAVLHYMVGIGSTIKGVENETISADAVRILLHARLMKRTEREGAIITRQGFQFLLLSTHQQVWYFMLKYLDTCEERNLPLPECLATLFQLSFSTLGRDYSSEGMNSKMQNFLQHLREFGLVFQRKRREGRFYPTRLAINIASDSVANIDEGRETGYIVVETNFRVYAYTASPLHIAILALFTDIICRCPKFVVGKLTRDSVRQAMRGGITAAQIIKYLEQHVDPIMLANESTIKSSTPLPPTVVDQIRLWERERNRLKFTESVIYNQFMSPQDFTTLRDYAQQINVSVWQNERTRTLVVTKNGHDDVKRYWRRYSN